MWSDLFDIAGLIVAPGWLLLLAAVAIGPRAPLWMVRIPQYGPPILLALLYGAIVFAVFADLQGGFDTFQNVRTLFQDERAVLAGWIHFLAFDLFIGAWAAERLLAAQAPRLLSALLLPLCFMFGPIGFALAFFATTPTLSLREAGHV